MSIKKVINRKTDIPFIEYEQYEKLKVGMLIGRQVKSIILTSRIWIPHLNQKMKEFLICYKKNGIIQSTIWVSPQEILLWNLLENVLEIISAKEDKISEFMKDKFSSQKIILQNFGQKWLDCYNSKYYPHYLHIVVCHTIYCWIKYGSLLSISNESMEHSHKLIRRLSQQMIISSGLESKTLIVPAQILYFRIKLLYYKDTSLMNLKLEPLLLQRLQLWYQKSNKNQT
jgi:hypothetical protein